MRLARLFQLSGDAWARHANPWSVWTRAPIIPLLALAIWSRAWIGAWAALPVLALLVWIWANPRVFAPAAPNDGWCWRAVMGERMLFERDRRPLPARYVREDRALTALSAFFALVLAVGLYFLDPALTLAGVAGALAAKFWHLDRMAWLHDDMTAEGSGESSPPRLS